MVTDMNPLAGRETSRPVISNLVPFFAPRVFWGVCMRECWSRLCMPITEMWSIPCQDQSSQQHRKLWTATRHRGICVVHTYTVVANAEIGLRILLQLIVIPCLRLCHFSDRFVANRDQHERKRTRCFRVLALCGMHFERWGSMCVYVMMMEWEGWYDTIVIADTVCAPPYKCATRNKNLLFRTT